MALEMFVIVSEPTSVCVGIHRPSFRIFAEDRFLLGVRSGNAERRVGIARILVDCYFPIVDALGEADVTQDYAVFAAATTDCVMVVGEGYS